MFRSRIVWFVPVALSVVGLGALPAPATAQATYNFSANFDGFSLTTSIVPPEINEIRFEGDSTDAPFGLTKLSTLLYSQVNRNTGSAILDTDPKVLGVQGNPDGSFVLLGTGSDKLFASVRATGSLDSSTNTERLSGTVNLTGGEGRFSGANGTLALSGGVVLAQEPNGLERTQISVTGSFKSVPDPSNLMALISLGVGGAGVLLSRRIYRWEQR
ncbi:MAG: hypothetical protein DSM106950_31605 [Stigonema ocellatum SAG 48.90 = DSM 106950]|nr:hypothetical protein [Stigonema ocellatum SAG 48.90 = DSM 106950]